MGIDITKGQFKQEDYLKFRSKLTSNLDALAYLLDKPDFGNESSNSASLGAELEMYIVGTDGRPLYVNQQLLEAAQDPQLTLELNRYNLEYNLTTQPAMA